MPKYMLLILLLTYAGTRRTAEGLVAARSIGANVFQNRKIYTYRSTNLYTPYFRTCSRCSSWSTSNYIILIIGPRKLLNHFPRLGCSDHTTPFNFIIFFEIVPDWSSFCSLNLARETWWRCVFGQVDTLLPRTAIHERGGTIFTRVGWAGRFSIF